MIIQKLPLPPPKKPPKPLQQRSQGSHGLQGLQGLQHSPIRQNLLFKIHLTRPLSATASAVVTAFIIAATATVFEEQQQEQNDEPKDCAAATVIAAATISAKQIKHYKTPPKSLNSEPISSRSYFRSHSRSCYRRRTTEGIPK